MAGHREVSCRHLLLVIVVKPTASSCVPAVHRSCRLRRRDVCPFVAWCSWRCGDCWCCPPCVGVAARSLRASSAASYSTARSRRCLLRLGRGVGRCVTQAESHCAKAPFRACCEQNRKGGGADDPHLDDARRIVIDGSQTARPSRAPLEDLSRRSPRRAPRHCRSR